MPQVFSSVEQLEDQFHRSRSLNSVQPLPVSIADIELLASGVVAPPTGFLARADDERAVSETRLVDDGV